MTESMKRERQGRGHRPGFFPPSQRGQARLQRLRRSDCGQAMVEYLVVAAMLLASLAILTLFLETFKDYGWRILDMVGSDYP